MQQISVTLDVPEHLRTAVADAIRAKEAEIRGATNAMLAWDQLQPAEQARWLSVADAALGELS